MCVHKFNNGNGAILCSQCGIIVASGRELNEPFYVHAKEANKPVFCSEKCECEYYNNDDIDEFDNGEYYF